MLLAMCAFCTSLTVSLSSRQNDLTYFRIDTKRFEILIAPFWGDIKYGMGGAMRDKGYTLFVLQRKPGQT